MALKPWEFERLESVRAFDKMLEGAVRRYHLMADLVGFLRVDVLLGAGVTYSEERNPLPPKPGTPTFQKVMGRDPVPLAGPLQPDAAPAGDVEPDVIDDDKALRARALLWEATYLRNQAEASGEPTPPEEPTP